MDGGWEGVIVDKIVIKSKEKRTKKRCRIREEKDGLVYSVIVIWNKK